MAGAPNAVDARPAKAGPSTFPAAVAGSAAVKLKDGKAGNSCSDKRASTALVPIKCTPCRPADRIRPAQLPGEIAMTVSDSAPASINDRISHGSPIRYCRRAVKRPVNPKRP